MQVRRPRNSIKLDGIDPRLYNKIKILSACEDCSHFAAGSESCTLGYNPSNHRRVTQQHSYELRGKLAVCRFIEID
jgi:hypothetical protein